MSGRTISGYILITNLKGRHIHLVRRKLKVFKPYSTVIYASNSYATDTLFKHVDRTETSRKYPNNILRRTALALAREPMTTYTVSFKPINAIRTLLGDL